ncbi:hypothetical protein V8F20_012123 [Naviculisporaceae sp. PSN 640]
MLKLVFIPYMIILSPLRTHAMLCHAPCAVYNEKRDKPPIPSILPDHEENVMMTAFQYMQLNPDRKLYIQPPD